MSLIKNLTAALTALLLVSSASASEPKEERYIQFFDGAMTVYTKFQEFNKEESVRFENFINSRWASKKCSFNCIDDGREAAKEYAAKMKVKLNNEI